MFDIEDLALTTANVAAITPKLIVDSLLEVARNKVVFAQFFKENRDLIGKAGLELEFPKEGSGISFEWGVSAGSTPAESTMVYTGVTIRVQKVGGKFPLHREAIQSGMRDVIKDHLYQGGLVYKETIDDRAYAKMIGSTAGSLTFASADTEMGFGTSIPVLSISSVNINAGSTIRTIDYRRGTLYFGGNTTNFAGTVWFKYATVATVAVNACAPGYGTGGSFNAMGLNLGKSELIAKGRNAEWALVKDADIPYLLYDEHVPFLDASAYHEAGKPQANAEIGKIWNLRIVTTSRELPNGVGVVVDKDRLGYHVIKRPLEAHKLVEEYEYDKVTYVLWSQQEFGVVDDQALCLVLAGTSNYPSTEPADLANPTA